MRCRCARALVTALTLLGLGAFGPTASGAQAPASQVPWTVTVTPTMNPLPIGFCGAVRLTVRRADGTDTPRNPAGARISLADFDMAVVAPDGKSVVGQSIDAYHWSVCACQKAPVGTIATITATYPARALPEQARVSGAAVVASATVTTAPAKGDINPPGCGAAGATAIAQVGPLLTVAQPAARPAAIEKLPATPGTRTTPTAALDSAPRTPAAALPTGPARPASPTSRLPAAPAPAGVTVTGTPASATLAWQPVAGVASYMVVRRQAGAPATQQTLAPSNVGMYDGGLQPATAYSYTIRAIQLDGREGSTDVPFITPPAMNPKAFTAEQTGDGQVELSWQPVDGASYYVLFGPGAEGGKKVNVATSYVATSVPLGAQTWAVASYYEPGPVTTVGAAFSRVQLTVTTLLSGWVDLHTHPMINLAFGGKLVHGGVDIGSLLPADASCSKRVRATSMMHALSDDRPSHGGWNLVTFPCGDELRKAIVHGFQEGNSALVTGSPARGFPDFDQWPKWNDITHQKMWFEWIKRARDGGLRVMVALATNNATLADAVAGSGDGPTDDRASADLQLTEIKSFVARHHQFMEVALGAADIKRIVQANKIAVVLGVEIDNIGNFNKLSVTTLPPAVARLLIANEIQRLYADSVRYVFPVHVVDNVFGGTAIYQHGFNTSNLREAGHYWTIECADVTDNITYTYQQGTDVLDNVLRDAVAFVKLGLDPFRHAGPGPACPPPVQPQGQSPKSRGHRNAQGITQYGEIAIKEMMKRGMIVDIDHMSQKTADATLDIAEMFDYPLVSGHTGVRGLAGSDAENSRTPRQLERLSKLHGMFGLGSDGVHAYQWARLYQSAMIDMGYHSSDPRKANYLNGAVSFGTDLNGLVRAPAPGGGTRVVYSDSFPMSSSGSKFWNYNTDGVAHYGMLADFVRDVRTAPSNGYIGPEGVALGVTGADLVDKHLFRSANYFWQMWERIEARKGSIP